MSTRPEEGVGRGAVAPLGFDAYLEGWARLHGGYDPRDSRLAAGWLRLVYVLARPLARRGVAPAALTISGAFVSVLVVVLAALGGRWPLMAVAVVVVSGLLDNLDGAVAVLSGRTSRLGYVLDSMVDRVSDVLYLVALVVLGAPVEVAALGGFLMMLQELLRARAGNAGMAQIGVVTVWERPTRVILTAFLMLGAGLVPERAETVVTAGAWAWVALGLVGLTQLSWAVYGVLRQGR